MRYPLWAFLFVFMLPPFALHALLTGKATIDPAHQMASVQHSPLIAPLLR